MAGPRLHKIQLSQLVGYISTTESQWYKNVRAEGSKSF